MKGQGTFFGMRTKSIAARIAAVALALVLVIGLLPIVSMASFNTTAEAATITGYLDYPDEQIRYGSYGTRHFTVSFGDVSAQEAYCAQASLDTPKRGGYEMTEITDDTDEHVKWAAAMWFSYGAPGFDESMWPATWYDGTEMTADRYRVLSHIVISNRVGHDGQSAYGQVGDDELLNWIEYNIDGYCIHDHDGWTYGQLINDQAITYVIGQKEFAANGGENVWPTGFSCYVIDTGTNSTYTEGYPSQMIMTFAWNPYGYAYIKKASANVSITDNNTCYSLEGATYGVYGDEACTDLVCTLVTDASGTSEEVMLAAGSYWVKETWSPTGYVLDTTVYPCEVNVGETTTVYTNDEPLSDLFLVQIVKHDDARDVTSHEAQGTATLQGAIYCVEFYAGYFDSADAAQQSDKLTRTWNLTTNDEGIIDMQHADEYFVDGDDFYRTSSGQITYPLGTYVIYETNPPNGYILSTARFYLQVVDAGNGSTSVIGDRIIIDEAAVIADAEPVIRGGVQVQKLDADSGMAESLGSAELHPSTFAIINDSAHDVDVDGITYAPQEIVKRITTDPETLIASTQPDALPYGSYTLYEESTGTGYLISSQHLTFDITYDGQMVTFDSEGTISNSVKRGDIELIKADQTTQERLRGCVFTLTSLTTGESHVVMTDENGYFSSSASYNAHTFNTNANDAALSYGEDGTVVLDESLLDASCGIWFGQTADGGMTNPNDERGALVYDTYTLSELPCTANGGLQLMDDITITITRDTYTVNLGTVDDPEAAFFSLALDADDGDKIVIADSASEIIETLTYAGLVKGHTYSAAWALADVNTSDVLASGVHSFIAEETSGTVTIEIEANTLDCAGHTLAICDILYDEEGRELATHNTDFTDADQTVSVIAPNIGTVAYDGADGDKIISQIDDAVIVDTVSYTNLRATGRSYDMVGTLYNKTTQQALTDADGNEITASCTFTPDTSDGSVEMTFTFDATLIEDGTQTVVFEVLYRDGEEVVSHCDFDDARQTVNVVAPHIETSAFDSSDNDKTVCADTASHIVDIVSYDNLVPGKEYTLTGSIIVRPNEDVSDEDENTDEEDAEGRDNENADGDDADTGDSGADGDPEEGGSGAPDDPEEGDSDDRNQAEGETDDSEDDNKSTDEPEELADATDAESISDSTFESGQSVDADGESINDADESENTSASEDADADKEFDESEGIEDEIDSFDEADAPNEIADDTSNSDEAEDADEPFTTVYATTTFTPEESSGTVDVTFDLDSSQLAGQTLVVYETLSYNDVQLAEHADINSETQSVAVVAPEIQTDARDAADKDKNLLADQDQYIIDTVTFSNLIPGTEYSLAGVLMDKASEQELAVNGSAVRATQTFIPDEADGSVEVTFEFDAEDLGGKNLVVFEYLYKDDLLVASHADLDDDAQTVHVAEATTIVPVQTSSTPVRESLAKTGRDITLAVAILVGIAVASVFCVRTARKQKKISDKYSRIRQQYLGALTTPSTASVTREHH